MKSLDFGRSVLGGFVVVAMLAGCGGSQPPIGVSRDITNAPYAFSNHQTFHYTGAAQWFVVPAHTGALHIIALGGAGAGCLSSGKDLFGRGGRVFAIIQVRPREKLYVFVGGEGSLYSGGFNGGGKGINGGGGASDVRRGSTLTDRIVVAAGGGGEGTNGSVCGGVVGGNGGGDVGGDGGTDCYSTGSDRPSPKTTSCAAGSGGMGANQMQGGAAGVGGARYKDAGKSGAKGKFGSGGTGGAGGGCHKHPYGCGWAGSGGGGGYYGGGGGGGGAGIPYGTEYGYPGGGGGGGSSWVEPKAIKTKTWRGWKTATGNGLVVISW